MEIILFRPEIPQNTGNIIRTCFITGTKLTLVTPFGFCFSQRKLKRAGLDYYDKVKVQQIDDLESYLQDKKKFYFFSSKATKKYADVNYEKDSILIFGSETSGLPKNLHDKYFDKFVTIPMLPNTRCLNLANSTCIALYEVLRQNNFDFS